MIRSKLCVACTIRTWLERWQRPNPYAWAWWLLQILVVCTCIDFIVYLVMFDQASDVVDLPNLGSRMLYVGISLILGVVCCQYLPNLGSHVLSVSP